MQCPKCEEGILRKVKIRPTGKIAYLCDSCQIFWWEDEQIAPTTGHIFSTKQQTTPENFVYVKEKDKEEMQIKDEKNREDYELSKGGEI